MILSVTDGISICFVGSMQEGMVSKTIAIIGKQTGVQRRFMRRFVTL